MEYEDMAVVGTAQSKLIRKSTDTRRLIMKTCEIYASA